MQREAVAGDMFAHDVAGGPAGARRGLAPGASRTTRGQV
jgi:hypothetical protein